MNKIKLLWVVLGAAFILTEMVYLTSPVTIGAAETCNIVTIRGRSGLEPNLLKIKKGDCVVWINFTGAPTQTEDARLTFKEGEKCLHATKAPVGFKMDVPSGCYIAGWISYGQTASLMFTEPGTYNYEVDFNVGGNTSGTIIVE
jgi:plastocyanin